MGARLSTLLVEQQVGEVVVAGRSGARAHALARSLGAPTRGAELDASDPEAVRAIARDATVIVSCVEVREAVPLCAAVSLGLAYTDVTASSMWRTALALRDAAERSGARVLIGAGLVPGLSSVLARVAAERAGPLAALETNLLLGIGDRFGPDALAYLLRELSVPLRILEDGREREVAAFSEPREVRFPAPHGVRRAFRAPFADQHFFPRSLGVTTASSRLALDPPWAGPAVATLARLGIAGALGGRAARTALHRLLHALGGGRAGPAEWALVVEARGARGSVREAASGRGQAGATALATAVAVRALATGAVSDPGVWFAEQVLEPEPFLAAMRRGGIAIASG